MGQLFPPKGIEQADDQHSTPKNSDRLNGWIQDNSPPFRGISRVMANKAETTKELHGWDEIAGFLGLPVATAQRWHKSGMPVHRGGRYVYANPDELTRWLNMQSPSRFAAHIATTNEDLAAELKQALTQAKSRGRRSRTAA